MTRSVRIIAVALVAAHCVGMQGWAAADFRKESPAEKAARMAWFQEARFGMFIHWGLYAVPAGEWKGQEVPGIGEWIMNRAKIPLSEYRQLLHQFNPARYDPVEWVRIAKRTGMRYIVITSKHHDGFCLWDSKETDYDVASTPYGKDLLKPWPKRLARPDCACAFTIRSWTGNTLTMNRCRRGTATARAIGPTWTPTSAT